MKQGETTCRTTSCGITNKGQTPLFQSIQVQNPTMSPFPMWTWCEKMGLSMEAITRWQLRLHIFPHARISKNLECGQRDTQTPIE